jgi:hypothetical protein
VLYKTKTHLLNKKHPKMADSMQLELNAQFFEKVIDLTRGRRVNMDAIVAILGANRDKTFKEVCMKLLVEGVRLEDSRKWGGKTLKSILSENNVQLGDGTKTAGEDELTVSRITRALAPLFKEMGAPSAAIKGKPPMADLNEGAAGQYWLCVSAMWCEHMWLNEQWRAAYLATMLALDHAMITSNYVNNKPGKRDPKSGVTITNRAIRLFGHSIAVDPKKGEGFKNRDEYVAAGVNALKGLAFDTAKANVKWVSVENAKKCLLVKK